MSKFIVSFENRKGQIGYVTKMCPLTVKFSTIIEAPHVAKYTEEEAETVKNRLAFYGCENIQLIDASDIDRKRHRRFPVIKVDNGSKFAETYGIQDWHHLHIRGELIYVVVWDTRLLEQVIQLADIPDEWFKDTYFIDDDNHKPLRLRSSWHEADTARYRMEYKMSPEITDEQFNNIRISK